MQPKEDEFNKFIFLKGNAKLIIILMKFDQTFDW